MTDPVALRLIEPFSYFSSHASAIVGLGGPDIGPDPNYCFHTHYDAYRPGAVIFNITIADAHASFGELAIRIHAHKPDSSLDISLVAGTRAVLDGIEGEDIQLTLRIAAIPGVLYAMYGYLSEPSDLRASHVRIAVEERGDDATDIPLEIEARPTAFDKGEFDFPDRMVADHAPSFRYPVSQPCTIGQIKSSDFAESWSNISCRDEEIIERWRTIFPLQVLETYGMLRPGAAGLLIDSPSSPLLPALRGFGATLLVLSPVEDRGPESGQPVPGDSGEIDDSILTEFREFNLENIKVLGGRQFDFAVSMRTVNRLESTTAINQLIEHVLKHMLLKGIAVFLFDYAVVALERDVLAQSSGIGFLPHRDDIEQMAMRIMGEGCEIAQLSFPDGMGGNVAAEAVVPFGLIVRR
jgi:hypothetical protein